MFTIMEFNAMQYTFKRKNIQDARKYNPCLGCNYKTNDYNFITVCLNNKIKPCGIKNVRLKMLET